MTGDPQEIQDVDYPIHACPACGVEQVDMDGFGFIACLPAGFKPGDSFGQCCGFCTHASASGNPMKCDFCGTLIPT
jgi:hypothetical protein